MQLAAVAAAERAKARKANQGSATPDTLAALCAATLAFPLHGWQELYCQLLERLRTEKGCRFLICAPPRYGKTVITSQRLPAYLLAHDPLHRVGVACYNETHATNQTAVCRDLMASPDYAAWFPQSAVSKEVSAKQFTTPARALLHDGQPSVMAMGLLSGFVGKGVDTLIIDDPYPSADASRSEATNGAVWRWWEQTTKPRIFEDANVVVMFHRYHDDDVMARLEKEGGWEVYRFPAIADGEPSGHDPAGIDLTLTHGIRQIGEALSPMRSLENLRALESGDIHTFASQFQGRPMAEAGGMFKVSMLGDGSGFGETVFSCRAWDLAATSGAGDYTAGVRIDSDRERRYHVSDGVLLQGDPDEVDTLILKTARQDGRSVKIRLAQDPGSAGKRDAARLARMLSGYNVEIVPVTGAKEVRARPFAAQVNAGNVSIADTFNRPVTTGPYRKMDARDALLKMLAGFPFSAAKKDGVDAAADAFAELAGIEPTIGAMPVTVAIGGSTVPYSPPSRGSIQPRQAPAPSRSSVSRPVPTRTRGGVYGR